MTEPFYRLTQHALEQSQAMGVLREAVIDCIRNPVTSWDSSRSSGGVARVARNERLSVAYNPKTYEVITVMWASTEWLPDRYAPPEEQPVSGWINLTAKEAERLLEAWGFIVKEDKGTTKLWAHPADPEARLIPFTTPSTRKANGKGSFRAAAQAVGVSVPEFQKGPGAVQKRAIAAAGAVEAAKHPATVAGPDPLGLAAAVERSKRVEADVQASSFVTFAHKVAKLTPPQRAALEALTEPLTASEVALLIERGRSVTSEILNHLIEQGLVVSRTATREDGLPPRPGPARTLYLAGEPGTVIPPLAREPLPAATTPVVEVEPEPEEAPVQAHVVAALTQRDLGGDDAVIDLGKPAERLFTATGTPWPTGGILIQDEDGVFYVARRLVEEGR